MKLSIIIAVAGTVCVAGASLPAYAGCVISPDGSAIDMVTDNGASEQKNCAIKCSVETARGVAQLSCGGNTPPLARGHSLCNYDRTPGYYKKVLSSEDSCKGGAGPAAAPVERNTAALPKAKDPGKPSFTCRIDADGQSAEAVVLNPYAQETHCQVDCQIATTRNVTFSISCGKTAAAGAESVLCKHAYDKGKLVKMVGGRASCVTPLADNSGDDKAKKGDKDDDDDGMPDQDEILRRMKRGEPMQNWLKK